MPPRSRSKITGTDRGAGSTHPDHRADIGAADELSGGRTDSGVSKAGQGATVGERVEGGVGLSLPIVFGGVQPKRLLWWGGLAALATVGVIEWPVALVVGAGSYVAERFAHDDVRRSGLRPPRENP